MGPAIRPWAHLGHLLAASLLALVALAGAASAQAVPDAGFGRFARIHVDVRPLLALGAGPQAEVLRESLVEALGRNFADRLGGGPDLVVRVRSLSMSAYAGGQGDGRGGASGGGGQNDYLDGEALLVGPGGQILARHPQLSVLPSSSGGAWYDPQSERRRVAAIAEQYAQWLRRSLPGN